MTGNEEIKKLDKMIEISARIADSILRGKGYEQQYESDKIDETYNIGSYCVMIAKTIIDESEKVFT